MIVNIVLHPINWPADLFASLSMKCKFPEDKVYLTSDKPGIL